MAYALAIMNRVVQQLDEGGNVVGTQTMEKTKIFPETATVEDMKAFAKKYEIHKLTVVFETEEG